MVRSPCIMASGFSVMGAALHRVSNGRPSGCCDHAETSQRIGRVESSPMEGVVSYYQPVEREHCQTLATHRMTAKKGSKSHIYIVLWTGPKEWNREVCVHCRESA